jgi:hypothetical protein
VFSRTHQYEKASGVGKPRGFWLSVEGEQDWRSWCESESWSDIGNAYVYEVTLAAAARVLRVTTVRELDALHQKLGGNAAGYRPRWDTIGPEYDGLIIAPYQWRRRYECDWYYGWDCASGVIWNLDAVESVERATNAQTLSDELRTLEVTAAAPSATTTAEDKEGP